MVEISFYIAISILEIVHYPSSIQSEEKAVRVMALPFGPTIVMDSGVIVSVPVASLTRKLRRYSQVFFF
ncbi:MAG: hypothetical protein ACUVTL_08420 [Thermoproteota archaeon]